MSGRGPGGASPYYFDAFISYSRRDEALARNVQGRLQSYARPWNRPRALRVFRDKTDIAGGKGLRQVIEESLATSRWLILIASPESAASEWVATELRWWLEHRGTENLLIAVARGDIAWRGDDFDWDTTTALAPPVISGKFASEPVWINVRDGAPASGQRLSDETVLDFAAPIHGQPKDDLRAVHGRQARRTRRVRRNVVAAVCALALIASGAGVYASRERNTAGQQTTVATANRLASDSAQQLGTNLQLAELLAVQAYRTHADLETEAALFKAVTYSPYLVRYLNVGHTVSALASADAGRLAVAGTTDGLVESWPLRAGHPRVLARLPHRVTQVAADASAGEVVATTRTTAVLAGPGVRTRVTRIPGFSSRDGIYAAAISPSGRYVVLDSYLRSIAAGTATGGSTVTVIDVRTGQVRQRAGPPDVFAMAMPSDSRLVLTTKGGPWMRLAVPDLTTLMAPTKDSFGAHVISEALSPGGGYVGYDNGGVSLWNTARNPGLGITPDLNGQSPANQQALAISADGSAVAAADDGTIYVSRTARGRRPSPYPQLRLPGAANVRHLTFAGDRDHLLAAAGNSITVWDVSQPSELARTIGVRLPVGCSACAPFGIMVAPGGRQIALSGGTVTSVAVVALDSGSHRYIRAGGLGNQMLALGWIDSHRLLLSSSRGQSPFLETFDGSALTDQEPATTGQYVALAPMGQDGAILEESDSGGVLIHHPGHAGDDRILNLGQLGQGALTWAVSPDQKYIAEYTRNAIRVASFATGQALTPGHGVVNAADFSAGHLIIQRTHGTEIWSEDGSQLQHRYSKAADFLGSSGARPAIIGSLLIQQQSPGSFTVTDIGTGRSLGSLNMPQVAGTLVSAMATDGGLLLTSSEGHDEAGHGGQLVLWQMTPQAWLRAACQSAGIALSAAQYQQHAKGQPVPGRLACSR